MSDLDRLFYWRGIAADYFNYRGEHIHVPLENRAQLLEAMGIDTGDPNVVAEEAYRLDVEPWRHWLKKTYVEPAGETVSFEINFGPEDQSKQFEWRLFDCDGENIDSGVFHFGELEETGEYVYEGTRYLRCRVSLGNLEPGYYQLHVESDQKLENSTLALFPKSTYGAQYKEKIWGVIIQLYTLRSSRNWGIGDFSDLRLLVEELAHVGADAVGLNPLHTLSHNLDEHFSPYSPSDRRFLNPLYIDPEDTEEFDDSLSMGLDQDVLRQLRDDSHVDYIKIRDFKYSCFQGMFKSFVNKEIKERTVRSETFFSFVRDRGESLLKFSFFEATHQKWKNALFVLDADALFEDVADGLLSKRERTYDPVQLVLLFHCYLQWLAEIQLEECQKLARSRGMKLGLIRDLAVGADGSGSEVSANVNLFCRSASVGAPPDPFAQKGQNWGMPPLVPSELRNTGYHHFIELLRTNMTHCGALRIDHAMSLMRLWWCPPDTTADHGAYVYYPFRELLGLLILESHLNTCVIIGEDLGVVPDEFREKIGAASVIANKVFYFEKDTERRLKSPEAYDENALAMINNHDVPTLVSWWNGTDLMLRNELKLLEEGIDYDEICAERNIDKSQLMSMLYEHGDYPDSWHGKPIDMPADEDLIQAIVLFLSRVNSKIFVMQLDDLLMMDEPVNVPGTFHQYDNWQRKLTVDIDKIFSSESTKSFLKNISNRRKKQSN